MTAPPKREINAGTSPNHTQEMAKATAGVKYLTPAVALAISWVWLGEVPAFISLLGGAVTVVGVCFIYLKANIIRLN